MNVIIPSARRGLTENELCAWLGAAAPGDQIAYHHGFLAVDCGPSLDRLSDRDRTELLRVARRARFAAEHGLAHLVQRRLGPDQFAYPIIARPRLKTSRRSVLAILAEDAA